MLIAVERLLIRLRESPSRATELIELRHRLRAELATTPDADEVALARDVLAAKRAVAAQLDGVGSCRTCATGLPDPVGTYAGGACCSGVTADLFDDDQLAALAHAGTRPRHLAPPHDAHAGCAFRGSTGCTLELDHRPARCVHYICDTLRREVHARGQLDAIEHSLDELDHRMHAFRSVRHARLEREAFGELVDAIDASCSGRAS